MQDANKKNQQGASQKTDKEIPKSQVAGTSGGEIPDPPKMPSKTKFHSDTERIFASILERDSLLWFRPLSGQFNIYYRDGVNQPEYVPDFVATTASYNLMIETKKAMDMNSAEVKAKAAAAFEWCKHASDYSHKHGGKPWKYLLIPHDAVAVNKTLNGFISS